MNDTPLIELRNCSVRQGGHQLLAPTTLSLARGERLALVGANGAGKTTLLRLMHGLLDSPGRQLHGQPRQAMVFQQPFFLNLSVRRNLLLALWLARVPGPEREARMRSALARVGLAGEAERNACALSGGQRQRLALARAWALKPELLFLDEPTSHLDPGARREVETLIQEFAEEGMSLVMSTHNLGQAKRLATRVIYLEGGRVIVDRPTQAFFNQALPEEAALFLKGELL